MGSHRVHDKTFGIVVGSKVNIYDDVNTIME